MDGETKGYRDGAGQPAFSYSLQERVTEAEGAPRSEQELSVKARCVAQNGQGKLLGKFCL